MLSKASCVLLAVLLLTSVLACSGKMATPTPLAVVPTPSNTPVPPTPTPASVPSPTSTSAATGTSTPTLAPTSTSTPVPTNTLTATSTPRSTAPLQQVAELETGADTLAFSPDDRLLAAGSPQDEVQVWDTATWTRRWTGNHNDWIRKIAFSPDGERLGSVSSDHTARLWDVETGDQIARLDYGYWVYGLDFSADGQRWATGSFDGKVVIADARTGQAITEFEHELMVIDLDLSPNNTWLAVMTSGSYGPGRLLVWDVFTQERRVLAEFNGVAYSAVAFSPDARWLAAGIGASGPITIWQTGTWPEAAQLVPPEGTVNRLVFSPNGQWLAGVVSRSEMDNRVVVWEVPTWRVAGDIKQADVVWDIAFSPDGRWFVTGLGQGIEHPPAYEGQLWETTSGRLVARMPHARQVLAVAFSHEGKLIATGSNEAVRIWEFQSLE
jgi:WD40 repeat protein